MFAVLVEDGAVPGMENSGPECFLLLQLDYVFGLKTLGAFRNAEFDRVPFVQGFKT